MTAMEGRLSYTAMLIISSRFRVPKPQERMARAASVASSLYRYSGKSRQPISIVPLGIKGSRSVGDRPSKPTAGKAHYAAVLLLFKCVKAEAGIFYTSTVAVKETVCVFGAEPGGENAMTVSSLFRW